MDFLFDYREIFICDIKVIIVTNFVADLSVTTFSKHEIAVKREVNVSFWPSGAVKVRSIFSDIFSIYGRGDINRVVRDEADRIRVVFKVVSVINFCNCCKGDSFLNL